MARRRRTDIKSIAWSVLVEYLESLGVDATNRIGRLEFIGEGASFRVYHASCRLLDDPDQPETPIIVKAPHANAVPQVAEEAVRERALLEHLATLDLPLRLPLTLATIPVRRSIAIVQTFIPGLELPMRSTRAGPEPWKTVAQVAAVCHRIVVEPVTHILPGPETRRDCAEDYLGGLDDLDGPEVAALRSWAKSHMPPKSPARLLHGDLHGRNLLVPLEPGQPMGLVDWAFSEIGDPALELAIVTDGSRRPFARTDGLRRLLDAYNAASDVTVQVHEVRLYEACMALTDWADAVEVSGADSAHAGNERRHAINVLRGAGAEL